MTKSEAIHRRVLRCRPAKRNAYVTTHEALLAEEVQRFMDQNPDLYGKRPSLWQIIKGWFA